MATSPPLTSTVASAVATADGAAVTVACRNGDIELWHLATNEVEAVGTVESGLLAQAWSPDGELVVYVTGAFAPETGLGTVRARADGGQVAHARMDAPSCQRRARCC